MEMNYQNWVVRVLTTETGATTAPNQSTHLGGGSVDIYNSSTKAYRVADKQVGLIGADRGQLKAYNKFFPSDGTPATAGFSKVKIVQGTSQSADASVLKGHGWEIRYFESLPMSATKPFELNVTPTSTDGTYTWGTAASVGTHSAVVLSGLDSLPEVQYQFYVNVTGPRLRQFNSEEMADGIPVSFLSPATYTAADAAELSNLYLNLAFNANLNSMALTNIPAGHGNAPFVAFAVDSAGTGTGVTIANIVNGVTTSIPFMVRRLASGTTVTDSLTVTAEMRETFANILFDKQDALSGSYPGTFTIASKIIPVDLLDTTARVNTLLFMALDTPAAFVTDETPDRKNKLVLSGPAIDTAFTRAFTTVSKSFEGQGYAKNVLTLYRTKHKPDMYTSQAWGSNFNFIQTEESIASTGYYTTYSIITEVAYEDGNHVHDTAIGQNIVLAVPATRVAPTIAAFTGAISTTNLTVTLLTAGTLSAGTVISGAGVTAGTTIVSQTSGTTGGNGVYVVSASQTVSPAVLMTGRNASVFTTNASGKANVDEIGQWLENLPVENRTNFSKASGSASTLTLV